MTEIIIHVCLYLLSCAFSSVNHLGLLLVFLLRPLSWRRCFNIWSGLFINVLCSLDLVWSVNWHRRRLSNGVRSRCWCLYLFWNICHICLSSNFSRFCLIGLLQSRSRCWLLLSGIILLNEWTWKICVHADFTILNFKSQIPEAGRTSTLIWTWRISALVFSGSTASSHNSKNSLFE